MSLDPLLAEISPIPSHALIAIAVVVLGTAQLLLPKGSRAHRFMGYAWVIALLYVAISGFFIHGLRLWGMFGPIHLLSVLSIVSLGFALHAARTKRIRRHRIIMSALLLSTAIAGVFTLIPGRVMHEVVFG